MKVLGLELTGRFFKDWNPREGIRLNLLKRVRSPMLRKENYKDYQLKYVCHFEDDEFEMVKLREALEKSIENTKKEVSRLETSLRELEVSHELACEIINRFALKQAYKLGRNQGEEDGKTKRKIKRMQKYVESWEEN